MEYFHEHVTEKSWEELKVLQKKVNFILIGGWAIYLYTRQLKSKDIDIIVDFDQLPILQNLYPLTKNDRLKKYEAVRDVVQMDIYLPHYSHLGIAVAEIQQHTEDRESFRLIDPNYLFALKVYALAQRGHSVKGRKDFLDIISLHSAGICNLPFIATLLREHKLEKEKTEFVQFLHESTQLPELNISSHRYAKFKREILGGLSGL